MKELAHKADIETNALREILKNDLYRGIAHSRGDEYVTPLARRRAGQ